jgi:hypothetical protein
VASPAGAEGPPAETVHLQYTAARSCPGEAEFVSALRRDTDAFDLVELIEARRLIFVELRVQGKGASGFFRFFDRAHGTTIERELTGPDCGAVARALALMLALAMHRLSEPSPPGEPPLPPPEPPSSPKTLDPSTPPTIVEAPASSIRRASPPPAAQGHSPSAPVRVSLDLQGEITSAVLGTLVPFASMTLELQPAISSFRPVLGIGLRQSLSRELAVAGGGATFLWTAGALRMCPHVVAVRAFEVAPCVEVALGRLGATAGGLPESRSSTDLWTEAAALVRGRWHFSPRSFLAVTGGMLIPLERTRFELSSGALISQTPPLGFRAGLGLGLDL